MITVLTLFVILIFLILVVFGAMGYVMWQKVRIYLEWNTRYQTAEYQQAIMQPKQHKPAGPARKLEKNGRELKSSEELVDLADVDWEKGYKALEDIANGA